MSRLDAEMRRLPWAGAEADGCATRSNWCKTTIDSTAGPGCSTSCSSWSSWGWACRSGWPLRRFRCRRGDSSSSSGTGSNERVSTSVFEQEKYIFIYNCFAILLRAWRANRKFDRENHLEQGRRQTLFFFSLNIIISFFWKLFNEFTTSQLMAVDLLTLAASVPSLTSDRRALPLGGDYVFFSFYQNGLQLWLLLFKTII